MCVRPASLNPKLIGLPIRWAALVLASTLVLICVSFVLLLWSASDAERDKASVAAANLSTALTQDIARNLELYDLSIQGVLEGLAKSEVMASPPEIRQSVLFDRAATAPYLGSILVDDENGNAVYDSASLAPRRFNYADREFFHAHRTRSDLGLFISAPYLSRTDQEWVINLSRRFNKPDGSFGGVVAGTFRLEYLHQAFSRIKLGEKGSITLFRTDGTVMMREPYDPDLLGAVKRPMRLFELLSEAPEGELQAKSVVDGVDRLYHYQRVGSYPLVLNVAESVDDIYADWWRKAIQVSVMLFTACFIIIGLAVALRHELQRRVEAEAALMATAREDPLTRIANRRRFDEVLVEEMQRASRHGWPLALLMIDADHFKAYNDAFGHVAGDAALVALAGCLARHTHRSGDLAARYGGEEFAVVLPHVTASEAQCLAERIRGDVLALGLQTPTGGSFSVSIGIAAVTPRVGEMMTDLIQTADSALYAAKAQGRDRAVLLNTIARRLPNLRDPAGGAARQPVSPKGALEAGRARGEAS